MADPENGQKKALLFEVFLAKEEQWLSFSFPEELIGIVRGAKL